MTRRKTSISTPVAHLVGPGKLKVINARLAFSIGDDSPVRLDPTALRSLYCYGDVGITDEAFQVLFAHDVEVAWLTPSGSKCKGRLVRSDAPRTHLRMLQHIAFQEKAVRLEVARRIVGTKIESQRQAARHYQRQGCGEAGGHIRRLRDLEAQSGEATSVESLRGVEGAASAAWFDLLGNLLVAPWQFTTRQRRPPPDPVNALLSLGYTWLLARTVARCEAAGLEVALGALHEYRAGRPSLACDLIEPLRVPAVDRWVVAVCNQPLLSPDDFVSENGGMRLKEGTFGRMLNSWQGHWLEGEHERTVDELVEQVIATIRGSETRLPTPSEDVENAGGSGNSAKP